MIHLTLGNISITNIGHSSGYFMGENNTIKQFRSNQTVNEVVGVLSGDKNAAIHNLWIKNKRTDRSE